MGPDDLTAQGAALLTDRPACVIGSGGATLGLGTALGWREDAAKLVPTAAAEGPVLAVVGSCSELTATQIERAAARDEWAVLEWDPAAGAPESQASDAQRLLRAGQHVLVHSGGSPVSGRRVAELGEGVPQGLAAIADICRDGFTRLVIGGGDTSGDVLTLLGATNLTTVSVLDRDTCMCVVEGFGDGSREVVLKGGQIGSSDFFIKAADGERNGRDGHK